MLGVLAVVGYLLGAAAGIVINYYLFGGAVVSLVLLAMGLGGLLGSVLPVAYWFMIPPAVRGLAGVHKHGYLVVAIGADKKARLLVADSDGHVVRPVDKRLRRRYVWVADGESFYTLHGGKGTQLAVVFMQYSFPLEVRKAAAITKFRERGFESLEDLKLAVELPSIEEVEARIRELEDTLERVRAAGDKEVEREFGARKEEVVAWLEGEIDRLRKVRELVETYGGGASLTVSVDGATVRAADLISYLIWRHHPSEIERVITAETNAVLARMSAIDWLKQLMPVIIVAGMMVLAILAAIYMLSHGGAPSPVHTVRIGGG